MQLGKEFIRGIAIFEIILLNVTKNGTNIPRNLRKKILDKEIYRFDKEHLTSRGWRITLANNEIEDIKKEIRSLGNREILLKGATKKY